ncbi:hypothetical protein [Schleiferilactobacillus shenzhenensis]|uniref:hypothetical protein n=1 Tax=Schleiferilactobacillus shenzhenensis TaxID=1231337 RepID=UPI00058FCF87|nr:hypothetical protein [Schleiferilactobacillus shenzhenensis]
MRVVRRIPAVLISIGAAVMLVLTGCTKPTANSQQLTSQSSQTSQAAASRESKQAYYYDSLAAADRKKIAFAFKANEDSTGHQEVGVPYNVNMAVRNMTDKTIKFDQRDFLVYLDSHHKSNSARSGELVLKPGETTTVHNLFKGVGGQSFVGGGMFVYLNSQLPLAYTYQAFMRDGVTSANLKDQKVIDINNPQPQEDETSSAASDSDDDD